MHFVYKMDNLFRSMWVSYGNSSVTKGFQFLNLFELLTFCVFKMHHSKPHHHFSILSYFICYFQWSGRPSGLRKTIELPTPWLSGPNGFKNWNPFVTDGFRYGTLILRKRLSSLYTKCVQFLPWPSLLFCKCYVGEMMIPCQLSTFSEFSWSAFQFQGHLAQKIQ